MPNMKMPFDVPKEKQIRLIINADAKCEADDQYAIVHAVLSPRLQIKGIIGAHFGTRSATGMEESRWKPVCQPLPSIMDKVGALCFTVHPSLTQNSLD